MKTFEYSFYLGANKKYHKLVGQSVGFGTDFVQEVHKAALQKLIRSSQWLWMLKHGNLFAQLIVLKFSHLILVSAKLSHKFLSLAVQIMFGEPYGLFSHSLFSSTYCCSGW